MTVCITNHFLTIILFIVGIVGFSASFLFMGLALNVLIDLYKKLRNK